MSDKKCDKTCWVCGDRSSCKNYGVISCESCRAFFRRNAFRQEKLECYFGGNCQINKITRKFCRQCRIKKCFEIGMRKEWIMNDMQKEIRKNKIIENKMKKQCNTDPKSVSSDDSQEQSESSNSSAEMLDINGLFKLFADYDQNEWSDEDLNVKPIALPLPPVVSVDRPVTDYSNTLNELESSRLIEVIACAHHLRIPSVKTEGLARYDYPAPEILELLSKRVYQEMREMVKMYKNMRTFKGLCNNDKLRLVQWSSMEMILLRSAFLFDTSLNCWVMPFNNTTLMLGPNVWNGHKSNMIIQHLLYYDDLHSSWDKDPVVLDLLSCILLFNPNRPGLMHKNSIRLERRVYVHLLRRYLQLKYGSELEVTTRLKKLVNSAQVLQQIGKWHAHEIELKKEHLDLGDTALLKEIDN